jgi:hypothetical protein
LSIVGVISLRDGGEGGDDGVEGGRWSWRRGWRGEGVDGERRDEMMFAAVIDEVVDAGWAGVEGEDGRKVVEGS